MLFVFVLLVIPLITNRIFIKLCLKLISLEKYKRNLVLLSRVHCILRYSWRYAASRYFNLLLQLICNTLCDDLSLNLKLVLLGKSHVSKACGHVMY